VQTDIIQGEPISSHAEVFATLADEASGRTFTYLLGRRARSFLSSVYLVPGHELSHERVQFVLREGKPVGMLSAGSGHLRSEQTTATRSVVLRYAGISLPRMAIRALLLLPVLGAQGRVPGDSYYIQMVAVEPSARRLGLGKILMRKAEHIALSKGCRRVELDVAVDNADAVALYQSLGFVESFTTRPPLARSKAPTMRMTKFLDG